MANMGDLVTRLICDASQYTAGTDQARAGNKALSGSIDSIIGQLERQKKQMAAMGQTTQDNIIRQGGNGASEGSVNYALQLNNEVQALRESKIAQDAAQAAKNASAAAGAALLASLRDEAATLGMTSAELRIYRAEMAGVNPATLAAARSAQANIAAMNANAKALEESASKAAMAKQSGESLVANLKQQQATYGMTASEAKIYSAALAGASQADIQAAKSIQVQIDQRRRLDQQLQQSTSAIGTHQNKTMVLTESVRGLEDAVAGYSNNGLKGMLMATTNNVTQIGALAGGVAGLALSIGAVAALVGVSLLPKLYEWYTGTEDQEKATKRLDEEKERFYQREVQRINSIVSLTQNQFDVARDTAKMSDRIGRQDSNSNEVRSLQDSAQDLRTAAAKADIEALGIVGKKRQLLNQNPGLDNGPGGQAERFRREKMSEKDRKAAEEKDRSAAEELVKLDLELKAAIARRALLNQQAADTEKAALKQAALDKQKMRTEANAAEQAENQKESREFLEQEKRRAAAMLAVRKQATDTLMEMIKKASPAVGEQIEKKRAEEAQRKSIEDAQKRGIITADEANSVLSQIGKKQNLPAGGPSAAIQSGSTAADSAALKAMRKQEDDKQTKADKENTEKLVTVLEKIEKKDPITVTVMSI